LYFHGITIPPGFANTKYWSKRFTKWLLEVELPSGSARKALTEIVDIVEYLRKKQYKVLKDIKELSQTKPYKKNKEFLISVPGIGLITAMSFLTETGDISRFKNLDNLCSFIGLVPMTNSTGENEKVGNITVRQNKILRSLIIESSWTAIRNDPALMLAFQELIKKMEPNEAIIRIAKKLLNRIRFVLKNQKFYEQAVVK
jgi:transposase